MNLKIIWLFNIDESFDDVTNLYDINLHPNEVMTVAPVLYDALKKVSDANCREIYLETLPFLFLTASTAPFTTFAGALSPPIASSATLVVLCIVTSLCLLKSKLLWNTNSQGQNCADGYQDSNRASIRS